MKKIKFAVRILYIITALFIPYIHEKTTYDAVFIMYSYREFISYSALVIAVSLLLIFAFGFENSIIDYVKNLKNKTKKGKCRAFDTAKLFWVSLIPLLSGLILFSVEYISFMLYMEGSEYYAEYVGRVMQKGIFVTCGLFITIFVGSVVTYLSAGSVKKENLA